MRTAAAKERPILFSSAMVRSILEGRKTQARRVIKPELVEHNFTCAWNGEYQCREGEEPTAIDAFMLLWDSINAKRDGGKYAWSANPWVWVLEFKRVQP